jgi:hypothetical protein
MLATICRCCVICLTEYPLAAGGVSSSSARMQLVLQFSVVVRLALFTKARAYVLPHVARRARVNFSACATKRDQIGLMNAPPLFNHATPNVCAIRAVSSTRHCEIIACPVSWQAKTTVSNASLPKRRLSLVAHQRDDVLVVGSVSAAKQSPPHWSKSPATSNTVVRSLHLFRDTESCHTSA